jgi:hypothetical protein
MWVLEVYIHSFLTSKPNGSRQVNSMARPFCPEGKISGEQHEWDPNTVWTLWRREQFQESNLIPQYISAVRKVTTPDHQLTEMCWL